MSTLVGTAHSQPSRGAYVAYGALGMPLAFAALPLYVQVPALYASEVGLSLSLIGWILLAARIVDAVTDPLIGWASDHLQSRRTLIIAALPLLAIGLPALLSPPANAGAVWFACGYLPAGAAAACPGIPPSGRPHQTVLSVT